MSALIGGSSQASGPKRGIHIKTPLSFITGFEKVHREGRPREDSQVGLTTVRPTIV